MLTWSGDRYLLVRPTVAIGPWVRLETSLARPIKHLLKATDLRLHSDSKIQITNVPTIIEAGC